MNPAPKPASVRRRAVLTRSNTPEDIEDETMHRGGDE
jgi:hypothetical protein